MYPNSQSKLYDYYYHHIDNKLVGSIEELISNHGSTWEIIKYAEYDDPNFILKSERISHYQNVNLTFCGIYYAYYNRKILWDCNNATLVSTVHDAPMATENLEVIEYPLYFMEYSWAMGNYNHFLTEGLPRFLHFLKLKKMIPNLKLFYKSNFHMKNVERLPSVLGIPEEDVIIYDIENAKNYLVKDFYISNTFDPATLRDIRIKFFTDTHYEAYKLIANAVMNKIASGEIPISDEVRDLNKIYISRENYPRRRLINEPEWFSVLESRGYIKIHPENFNTFENIYLIKTCNSIVSEHGSALTNLLFVDSPHLKVCCFGHPYEHGNMLWSTPAKRHGFGFYENNEVGQIHMDRFAEYLPTHIDWEESYKLKIAPWTIDIKKSTDFINSIGM